MKTLSVSSLLVAGCLAALMVSPATAAPAKKAAMARFLIEVPHTQEECMKAMDEVSAMGPKALAQWDFGCEAGEHVAWAIVTAPDEKTALEKVPEAERANAKVHKLTKLTAAQVKEMHEKMK